METCISPLPEVQTEEEVADGAIDKWRICGQHDDHGELCLPFIHILSSTSSLRSDPDFILFSVRFGAATCARLRG
jgi:hypothetical protein